MKVTRFSLALGLSHPRSSCVKADNLRRYKETKLIAECRALLTSYDDLIMGLRMNQALYEAQERQYKMKAAELKASYDEKVRRLYLLAKQKGILLGADDSLPLLLPEEG